MALPDFVFELSWEVCNMVGGIHTVIQSKAQEMRDQFDDNYVCVGPHIPHQIGSTPVFREEIWNSSIYKMILDFSAQQVTCRMGRWNIPGEPKVLLIGFNDLLPQKDRILAHYWEKYGVNSIFGGHDYLEPVLFSHAAGLLIEQIFNRGLFLENKRVLVHCHEWMTACAFLHLKETAPEVASVFTTHATILGRTLSSRNDQRLLETYFLDRQPSQWARETGVESKHSVECTAAREADCFTTVSETTSEECSSVLGKRPDQVVHNGLSAEVPDRRLLEPALKLQMRRRLLEIAEEVTGYTYDPARSDIVVTSGRYEFRNKGIDLFLEAMLDLRERMSSRDTRRKTLAVVMCPAGHLQRIYPRKADFHTTHQLVDPENDPTLQTLRLRNHQNGPDDPVHVIFLPLYLSGADSSIKEGYWELLSAADVAVFPSWYEPWGYTPHEAISLGIPTITTDRAGFGRWAKEVPGAEAEKGVVTIGRSKGVDGIVPFDHCRIELRERLAHFLGLSDEEKRLWSNSASRTANKARWADFFSDYLKAYDLALSKAAARVAEGKVFRFRSFSLGQVESPSRASYVRASVRKFSVAPRFPLVLNSMLEFAESTISWKWHPPVVHLLSQLDPELWARVHRRPLEFLQNVTYETVRKIIANPELKKTFDEIRRTFQELRNLKVTFERAYFCMEYGITDKLRIYSGGLGMLAGDHLKTASDLKLPLAAFGLFYQYGYFRQSLGAEGQQLASYDRSELEALKLKLVQNEAGARVLLSVPLRQDTLYFQAWRLELQTVHLFLLDTNVAENPPHLRGITDRLYSTEPGRRLDQEWLLAMGGLKLISSLRMNIKVFHMNEGHTSFLVVGRALELMAEKNFSFSEALEFVRFTTIYTVHTPVPAGHEEFELGDARRLLSAVVKKHELLEQIMKLGESLNPGVNKFSMTSLAIRGSRWVNAVSKIHEGVSQRMFASRFPDLDPNEVPITHVTNGVHLPYWVDPDWQSLFYEVLGPDWPQRQRDVEYWGKLREVPAERIWDIKSKIKARFLRWLGGKLRESLLSSGHRPEYADVLGKVDPRTLFITHAKRMAPYKRADLLFQDPDRLHEILRKSSVPIVFIYAGKAHPADGLGQAALQRLVGWGRDERFRGSILVLEDYDLSYASRLLSGSDVWLNTPLRPLEASGTSGMKAAVNGTLHFSVADGWWPEVFNGKNGWMVGDGSELWEHHLQDRFDRERIFSILETQLLPEYCGAFNEVPSLRWAERVRESLASCIPLVSSQRMFFDYEERLYKPALQAARDLEDGDFANLRELCKFKATLKEHWHELAFENMNSEKLGSNLVQRGIPTEVEIDLSHPGLTPQHLQVQGILTRRVTRFDKAERTVFNCVCISQEGEKNSRWRLNLVNHEAGDYSLSFRATARPFGNLPDPSFELKLVKWV